MSSPPHPAMWIERLTKASNRRPYKPPELLFGATVYDAFAVDMWSLGVTFASFFTTLRFFNGEDSDDECDSEEEDPDGTRTRAFVFPSYVADKGFWVRDTLFDASRGEIGLAWSIFKLRGTPTTEIWPVSRDPMPPAVASHRIFRLSTNFRTQTSSHSTMSRQSTSALYYRTSLLPNLSRLIHARTSS